VILQKPHIMSKQIVPYFSFVLQNIEKGTSHNRAVSIWKETVYRPWFTDE